MYKKGLFREVRQIGATRLRMRELWRPWKEDLRWRVQQNWMPPIRCTGSGRSFAYPRTMEGIVSICAAIR